MNTKSHTSTSLSHSSTSPDDKGSSRRKFIKQSATAAAGLTILPRYVMGGPGYIAPSDKLNIAGIGAGGKGTSNLAAASQWDEATKQTVENIVALCDVDDERAATSFSRYPDAKRYKDFRLMLEEMGNDIDAVMISTPDHTHAVAAMACMQLNKHVYVEKPLTHNVYEARLLTEKAREYGVTTQMGNQGNSSDDIRRICEWIDAGTIGEVKEVHCWTNRPVWAQGISRPQIAPPVPTTLNWDLWLGPAPLQTYHPTFVPFGWRGWWDFGTGALGDMACHIIDPAFKALKLGYPTSVEASATVQRTPDRKIVDPSACAPSASIIHFEFPEREGMPPVTLHWYDGGLLPRRPEELEDGEPMGDSGGGVLFVGDKGKLMCDVYARRPRLLPLSKMEDFVAPEKTLERIEGSHQSSWVAACKEGTQPSSNFDYAGPLTEMILMGNLAIRSFYDGNEGRKKLLWDGKNMQITNYDPANEYVKRIYRDGWSLGV